MRRKSLMDEFESAEIKAVRAPRMSNTDKLPMGAEDALNAMDDYRRLILSRASGPVMEQALGKVRAALAFHRQQVGIHAGRTSDVYESELDRLHTKHGVERKPRTPRVQVTIDARTGEISQRLRNEVERLERLARNNRQEMDARARQRRSDHRIYDNNGRFLR